MLSKNIQDYPPVKEFIAKIGAGVLRYMGKDPLAIVYLRPDGVFYAQGLHDWLVNTKKKKRVEVQSMDDDGTDLDESAVKGRKVLIVDNDVVTGKGLKRSMEALRSRRRRLNIKDVKFATYFDRTGLADFSVAKYSPEAIWHLGEFDALDLKILRLLADNGRASFADIAKKTNLSSVGVRNRVANLREAKVLSIRGMLDAAQFCTLAAHVHIEADGETAEKLVEEFSDRQEVFSLMRVTSGRYNLMVGVLGRTLEDIEKFVEGDLRREQGVKRIDVFFGELPSKPRYLRFQV